MKSNKKYEDKCWGHNCERYSLVDNLLLEVRKVYERNKEKIIAYPFFLMELGLKRSTPMHWKECKPLNLKILEDVKMYCDHSIFKKIKDSPQLVFKYWELTNTKETEEITEEKKEKKEEQFIDTDLLGNDNEFKGKEDK